MLLKVAELDVMEEIVALPSFPLECGGEKGKRVDRGGMTDLRESRDQPSRED